MVVESEESLFPGERVLWTGRPQQTRRSLQDLGMTLYLVIIAPIAVITFVTQTFKARAPWWLIAALAIFAVGFLIQTAGYLINILVITPRQRASATYAITDRRVIVTSGLRSRTTGSAYISTLPPPQITNRGDGMSTVRFGNDHRGPRHAKVIASLRNEPASTPTTWFTLPALPTAVAEAALSAIQQARSTPNGNGSGTEAREASVALTSAVAASVPANAIPASWTPAPAEQVLWIGRPSRARWWYGANDLYTTVFGLVWTAVSAVIEWVVISQHGWPFTPIVLVFIAFGLYMIIGRVLWRRARIRRSTYLVTTQRVATIWTLREPRVISASVTDVNPPRLSNARTLTFSVTTPPTTPRNLAQSIAAALSPAATNEAPVFLDLPDAATVYRLVGAAHLAATTIVTSRT